MSDVVGRCRTRTQGLCRVTRAEHHRGNIFKDYAAGTDDGAASDRDTGSDKDAGGEPDFRFDDDKAADHVKCRTRVVVIRRSQVAVLGDTGVVSDADFAEGVEGGVIADPAVIADGEFPGIGDFDGGTNDDGAADFGAEEAKEKAAPSIHKLRRPAECGCLNDPPELHEPSGAATKIGRQDKALQILNGWRHRVKCRASVADEDMRFDRDDDGVARGSFPL